MPPPTLPPTDEVARPGRAVGASALEAVFRREWGRVLATVARLVGDLEAAEEMAQEAMVAALERWPFTGVPDNPGAWLLTTARNRALDRLRRARSESQRHEAIFERRPPLQPPPGEVPEDIPDDRLRLIFTCCHPALTHDSQVALTLRLLGGLSTAEIGRAFLVSEATVAQRISRAKQTLREVQAPYEVPEAAELPERLPAVLRVLYLIFNEGYTARAGDALVRAELCDEALRLCEVLARLIADEPEAWGLLALMGLHASRREARTGPDGALVLLEAQDRRLWDQAQIAACVRVLEYALSQGRPGPYQLQAAIAACHAEAPSWEATDWAQIRALYARLMEVESSPVVLLNHAVAVSMVEGPEAGLALLEPLSQQPALAGYHLLPAVRADLLRRTESWAAAHAEYERALALCENQREQDFLLLRIAECAAAASRRP